MDRGTLDRHNVDHIVQETLKSIDHRLVNPVDPAEVSLEVCTKLKDLGYYLTGSSWLRMIKKIKP